MALMSDSDKAKVSRIFARKFFNGDSATVHHDDIVAAVGAIDGAYENPPTSLGDQVSALKVAINQELPAPFSGVSASLKAALHVVYTVVKFGVDVSRLGDGD